ncbi:MAG: hypothetical protein A3K10_06915 [Bacteroidetes bacterium RIFCSPLOWO2_12_FULL_31_6]|nr:MAG: hypothetical protein A3K10_06915 [Bacteroidetes bacterium RIFCSPLOWO2_12_FULL_31_6]
MNTSLALKIEKSLGFDEGYLMILQVFYDIEKKKKKLYPDHPDLSKLRSVLFWDTDMEKINWQQQKNAVIKRVFERGNEIEKEEITHFYGKENINTVLK